MKNNTIKLTAVSVLTFIMLIGIISLIQSNYKDEVPLPEFSWNSLSSGRFGKDLSKYFTNTLAFSNSWRKVGSRLDSKISGNIVEGVYIADDRLIAADSSERGSTEESAAFVNSFADDYDGAVYFVAVPTSAGVYGDALPAHLSRITEKQQIDRLYEQLNGDIRRIDAYNLMKMLSDDRIYLRSDSRWTIYGAYCLYRTVIQKLGFQPVSFDKYTIRHVTNEYCGNLFRRTLYMKCEPDILDIYEYADGTQDIDCTCIDNDGNERAGALYDICALNNEDMYKMYLGERAPLVRIRTHVNHDRRLLLIGSECAASFVPFLTHHYSEITVYFPEYAYDSLDSFVDPNDYEQTLFLFGIDKVKTDLFKKIETR